ncbi:MAG: hypothetical protein LBC58_04515 [Clostridiales Family XIII bacterium]|jgi:UDP-3-O-[3-hydroxymyristoyl] glucosamine N-acyltransferase|nr:hypothetical protein [Clostridiales Family XIII bacterium]
MRLSDINIIDRDYELRKDGEFDALGAVTRPFEKNEQGLVYLEDRNYMDSFFKNQNVSAVVCTNEIADVIRDKFNGGLLITSEPRNLFFEVHNYLASKTEFYHTFKKETPRIAETAKIHQTAVIGDHNIHIGENTEIMAGAVIKPNTYIGDRVIIREGCIVGTPSFYYSMSGGRREQVVAAGSVLIKNNVDLHPGVSVELGVFGKSTIVDEYAKVGPLAALEHDSYLGKLSILCAHAVLTGFTYVGEGSFIGAGAIVVPQVRIGNRCKLSAGAMVTRDVPDDTHVAGNYAVEHNKFIAHLKESLTE